VVNIYENNSLIATTWEDFRAPGDIVVVLALDPTSRSLVFSAENGLPIPSLRLLLSANGIAPFAYERTDESGICKLHIAGEDQLELYAQSPDKTLFWHGTTRLDDAFVEVTVAPRCASTIRFFERGSPAIGIRAHLRHCASGLPVRSMTTDEGGCGGSYRLSAGEYELAVDQPGYWPQTIVVGPDVPTQWDVQVRRTASLELTLSNTSVGVGVQPGVELVYEESGESVADWLAADRAQGSLAPDTAGVMRVDSVPNGRYRYRVLAGDVVLASGHLDLAPHELTRKTIPY